MLQSPADNRRLPIGEIALVSAILLAAMLLRVSYFNAYLSGLPNAVFPQNDAREYWEMGRTIYQKGWLLADEGPFYQAPFYPYALAVLHQFGIHRIEPVLRLQAFLGVLSVLLAYLIARKMMSAGWASVAALLTGITHYSLFFESKILATTLGTFLLLCFAWMYVFWLQRQRIGWLIVSALLYSLSAICTANLLFIAPFVALHAAGPWKQSLSSKLEIKRAIIHATIFLGAFILGVLPVTLRNYFIGGSLVPISANSGVTLYMGTNNQAQGGLAPVEGLSNDIAQQKQGSIALASQQAGRELSPSEASSFWVHKTMEWIVRHPGQFLLLEGKKLIWSLYYAPPAVNYSAHFEEQQIPLLKILSWFSAFALFFGWAGIPYFLIYRTRETSFLLALAAGYLLLSLVYYASDRFLAALLPFLAILGIYSLMAGWNSIRAWRLPGWRRFAGIAIWIVLIAGLSFNPFLGWNAQREIGMGWYNIGVFYHDRNQDDDAVLAYEEAQKRLSGFPPLLLNLGVLYAERGDLEQSTRLFQQVLELDPTNRQAQKNLQINQSRMNLQ